MKQFSIFSLTLFAVAMMPACNFQPDAVLGDTNAKSWDLGTSYNYESSWDRACKSREIQTSERGSASCTSPGSFSGRMSYVANDAGRLVIEIKKDTARDNFSITSLSMNREMPGSFPSFDTVDAQCTEDKDGARTYSQRFVCTFPTSRVAKVDRFKSMTVVNTQCDARTDYSLTWTCSSFDPYAVTYGGNTFPEFR